MSYVEAVADFLMKVPDNVVFVNRHRIILFREDYMYRGATRIRIGMISLQGKSDTVTSSPLVRGSGLAPEARPWKGRMCYGNTAPTTQCGRRDSNSQSRRWQRRVVNRLDHSRWLVRPDLNRNPPIKSRVVSQLTYGPYGGGIEIRTRIERLQDACLTELDHPAEPGVGLEPTTSDLRNPISTKLNYPGLPPAPPTGLEPVN